MLGLHQVMDGSRGLGLGQTLRELAKAFLLVSIRRQKAGRELLGQVFLLMS